MKLAEGIYVRTKMGIKQIYRIDNNKTKYKYLYKLKKQDGDGCIDCGVLCIEDILKASHNIIDLIEENDLVTLTSKYCERDIYRVEGKFGEYISLDTLGDGTLIINNSKDIKSIVTKEQFESMSYKVN